MNRNEEIQNVKRASKSKKGSRICLFMLITVALVAIALGAAYLAAEHRISLNKTAPEKQVENALIKEAVL